MPFLAFHALETDFQLGIIEREPTPIVAHDRALQRAAMERVILLALDESTSWQEQRRWPEAMSAARRADGLLAGADMDEALRQRVRARRADLELLDRLENVRLERETEVKDGHFDLGEGVDGLYGQTFREAGLDVEALSAAEAGERARRSTVAVELAAVLDHWAWVRRNTRGANDFSWKHLVRVARVADPDGWRMRVREALERRDEQSLRTLASSEEIFGLAPATLYVLGGALLGDKEARAQAEAFLREAQRQHPNDFWLNYNLIHFFSAMQPPQVEDIYHFAAVSVALRPESPGAHFNLGLALYDKGQFDAAIAAYKEAIRIKKDYAEAHYNLGNALHEKGRLDEAIAEYKEAIRTKKDYAGAHCNLGYTLHEKGRLDEAITEYREAIQIKKDDARFLYNLGIALRDKGQMDGAIAEYREAIRIKKDYAEAHDNLGNALRDKGQLDEAIAECKEAIRLKKDAALPHNNLGNALRDKGQLEEALAEYRQAIRLKKDFAEAHYNLGVALHDKGLLDEAVAAYKEAIRLKKDYLEAHHNLGSLLQGKSQLDEAIVEYQEVIRIQKDNPAAYYNLGNALREKGRLDEAIAAYKEAIRLKNNYAEAHCNLGNALQQRGQFRQAVEAYRRGHELGSKNPRWRYPSAQWLQEAERLAQLDERLAAVLEGKDRPKDAAERLAFAQICQLDSRKRYAAAARFYDEAFVADSKLACEQPSDHRYNAAWAAALAGCGQGKDADKLDTKERTRLRQLALDWLRADLKAWRQVLDKSPDKAGPAIAQQMQHWLQDADFAGVRGPEALGKLPEGERPGWLKLWADVAKTLAQTQGKAGSEKNSGAK
jgi:tetratricopeptide (TPR) repeat protein